MRIARRPFLITLTGAIAGNTLAGRAQGLDTVSVGHLQVADAAPLWIAKANGYYRDVGLNVALTPFDSGADMIAPLGTGQLDIGAGSPSAGLYNAVARGVDLKIVADTAIGAGKVVVRKALVDSGRYSGPASLRGMRLAQPAKGVVTNAIAAVFLKTGGLDYATDVNTIYLGFPQQVAALENGAIDFTVTPEPLATIERNRGVGTIVATQDQFYPDEEIAVILYGGAFVRNRPDVARRFMVAYVRGLRFYRGALKGGRFAGPNAEAVIAIIAANLKTDPVLLRQITPNDVNPNARINLPSLARDYNLYRSWGYIPTPISLPTLVDMQYVDHSIQVLGAVRA